MSNIGKDENNTLINYKGVVGKALLEYRTGMVDYCANINPFFCNIMQCLYCENSIYKITMQNGDTLSTSDADFSKVDDMSQGFKDEDHEILFYDYVPTVDELFSYLFDEKSQFRIVRKSDHHIMNDYVRSKRRKRNKRNRR